MTNHKNLPAMSVLWIQAAPLAKALDSATWLDTTMVLRDAGWRIQLVCEGDFTGSQMVKGVEVMCLKRPALYLLGTVVFHLAVIRVALSQWDRIDVILFHQMSALWLLPLKLAALIGLRRRPLLVMDTRDIVTTNIAGPKTRLRRGYFSLVHALANRWADGQTAITIRMAEHVGIPPGKLWGVWPSGVDASVFRPAYDRRKWSQGGEPIRLLYVGKLHRERNLMAVCEAVDRAVRQGQHFQLTLVGSGPDESDVRNFANLAGPHIRVLPPVPHQEIPSLLATTDIGVTSMPSSDDQKFEVSSPIKLFEYIAAGLPFVATANACHKDVVGSAPYAFWTRDNTPEGIAFALDRVWAEREKLPELGAQALNDASKWTWGAAARKLGTALSTHVHSASCGVKHTA